MNQLSYPPIAFFFLIFFLQGCAGLYFRDAGPPPQDIVKLSISDPELSDYWSGIVFNGNKIGFTHSTLKPLNNETEDYEIKTEVSIRFHFLMIDKKIILHSRDIIGKDLSLKSFDYTYNFDGNLMKITGHRSGSHFEIIYESNNEKEYENLYVNNNIYPSSAIYLYPMLNGLEIDKKYSYLIYDGESRKISEVEQEITAYEESDLFYGKAYKIITGLKSSNATGWLSPSGQLLFELSLNGALIAHRETEYAARKYLAEAALNKIEALLEYSLIPIEGIIENQEELQKLELELSLDNTFIFPESSLQSCESQAEITVCRVEKAQLLTCISDKTEIDSEIARYLGNSITVPSKSGEIRELAIMVTNDSGDPVEKIQSILTWLNENIEKSAVDVFSALDVLRNKKGECQGYSYLFTAMARSLGIPVKIVNGIVYSKHYKGFLYHTWVEAYLGTWIPIDPIFNQLPADPTHLKLIEGETSAELAPLANIIGKLKIGIRENIN
jgi:hypothetical protein